MEHIIYIKRYLVSILIILSLSLSYSEEVIKNNTNDSNELYEYNDGSHDYDDDFENEIVAASIKPIVRPSSTDFITKNEIIYSWGKWSKWSKCSRTCGGGIQYRVRRCQKKYMQYGSVSIEDLNVRGNKEAKCVGIYSRFRVCQDKPCVKEQIVQCESSNNIPFKQVLYSWRTEQDDTNECVLNCRAHENSTIHKTIKKIDGTKCSRPAIYYTHFYRGRAVCVQGICKAVHSSGAIRSESTLDSSELCGSVFCNKISSVYNKSLSRWLNFISTIPIGALDIEITEIEPSSNILLLKSINNTSIINGEEHKNTPPGLYNYFHDKFTYTIENNLEKIISKGPLQNAFDLMLLGNATNKGIKYTYMLPIPSSSISSSEESENEWHEFGTSIEHDNLRTLKKKRKFNWLLVGFGPCNKTCGPGFRAPIFRCTREINNNPNNKHYTSKRCNAIEKPKFNEQIYKCNLKKCAAYWKISEWGKCLCVNDIGISSRTVECVQENTMESVVRVENSNCHEKVPHMQKSCDCLKGETIKTFPTISNLLSGHSNAHLNKIGTNLSAGVWMTSNWSDKCEDSKQEDCTVGTQHRTVVCDRKSPNLVLCDSNVIPSTFKFCKTNKDCTKGEWYTSEWSDCIGDCFNLHKKRLVMCIQNNIVVVDDKCETQQKPISIIKCNISEVSTCGPKWHYSEWSECSKLCGEGIQKRVSKCYEIDEKLMIFNSQKCRYKERQSTIKSCNLNECDESEVEVNTKHEIHEVAEQISCLDEFPNCQFINKSRLCALKYYSKQCCLTCYNSK